MKKIDDLICTECQKNGRKKDGRRPICFKVGRKSRLASRLDEDSGRECYQCELCATIYVASARE